MSIRLFNIREETSLQYKAQIYNLLVFLPFSYSESIYINRQDLLEVQY